MEHMNTTTITHRINTLKLLEQFCAVLSRELYQDNDNAWTFCELLKDIIYTSNPTRDRHSIVSALPARDIHFSRHAVLHAITEKINDIAALATADPIFTRELSALLQ